MNKVVEEIGQLHFEGNIIPHSWYEHFKTDKGKLDLAAIIILSEVIYWYRPTITRDEETGRILEVKQKFKGDKLQKSYAQLANYFGLSKLQVARSMKRLQKHDYISMEFRTITIDCGVKLNNVLFVEPNPEKIKEISVLLSRKTKKETYPSLQKSKEGLDAFVDTYTEITTEITSFPSEKKRVSCEKGGDALASLAVTTDAPDGAFSRDSFKQVQSPVSKEKTPATTDRAKIISDYWNSKDGLLKVKSTTRLFQTSCLLIEKLYRGSAPKEIFNNKKFDRRDFIQAIDQFHRAATHGDYEPVNAQYKERLRKTSLKNFLMNEYSDSTMHKSLFLHYLNTPAALINNGHGAVRTRKDDSPAISVLSAWYEKFNTNGNGASKFHFNEAVKRLKTFKESYGDAFIMSLDYWRQCYNVQDELSALAEFLTEAVEHDFKKHGEGMKLTSGWLCSDRTFDERLPKYLSEKAFIRRECRV